MFSKSRLIKQLFSSAPTDFSGHVTVDFAGRKREIKLCRNNIVPNGSSKTLYTVADQVLMISDLISRTMGHQSAARVMGKSELSLYGSSMENITVPLSSAQKAAEQISTPGGMPHSLPAQMRYTMGDNAREHGNDSLNAISRNGLHLAEHSGMEGLYTAMNNGPYMKLLANFCANTNNQINFEKSLPTGMASLGKMNIFFAGSECTNPHDLMASSYMLDRAMRPETPLYNKLQTMSKDAALDSEEKSVGRALLSSYEVINKLQEQCNGRPYTSKLIPLSVVTSITKAVGVLNTIEQDSEYDAAIHSMMTQLGGAYLQRDQAQSPSM